MTDVLLDATNGVELRRVVVGFLATNCWIIRSLDSDQALVVDPGAEPGRILAAAEGLAVTGIVLTHAHADHVLALPALDAPVLAHPDERQVWTAELDYLATHGHLDAGTATAELVAQGRAPKPDPAVPLWDGRIDRPLLDGDTIRLGALTVTVVHTPGHSPGSITLQLPGHLLTGDTLFPGGPGLTGEQWPLTSFPAVMRSVRRLLTRPDDTTIHPGHGRDTTVAAERPHVGEWEQRGW